MMSKPQAAKECVIFSNARQTNTRSATRTATATPTPTPTPVKNVVASNANVASNMANVADVLSELRSLRSEFSSKLDGINNQLGELRHSMSVMENNLGDIKRDVTANEQRIEEAEVRIAATEDALDKTETALAKATKRLTYLEEKTEDLENRGRRKNIRLFGLKEGAEGTRPVLDFIKEMLPQWLGTEPDRAFTLERAHRTLAPAIPNQNRAVLLRFLNYQDKEFVLRATRQRDITHDGSKLAFAQDFSAETMRRRREFNAVKKLFVDMGSFRGFHLQPCKMRVLHNGRIQMFSSPQEAEEFYRRISAE